MSEITYQLVVNSSGAVKSIQQIEGELNQATQAANSFSNATKNVNKGLGTQERSANLAGAAALELSRIASDAAYGIRGMANNIGQLVTMFTMLAAQTNATTGATLGFMGAIKATWAAIKGPLGIVIAIQGLLTVLTLWEANTQKQKKAQKELNDQLEVSQRLIKSIRTPLQFRELLKLLDEGGIVGQNAREMLRDSIKNWDELIKTMSAEDIVNSWVKLLEMRQNQSELEKIISENQAEVNVLYDKFLSKAEVGKDNSKEFLEYQKRTEDHYKNIVRAEDVLSKTMRVRVRLEAMFREERGKAGSNGDESYKRTGILIDEMNRKLLDSIFSYEEWSKAYVGETEKVYKTIQELHDLQIEMANYPIVFTPEALENVRLFSSHLMSVSDIMYSFGDISHSVYDTMSKDTAKARKDAKILFDTMKSFAIAAITVNTLVAASKVEGVTVLDRSLQMAAIIAQGVAQVIAVASQKMDGTSKLKGANVNAGSTGSDDTIPVATTGFSNLGGGEKPNSAIRVYVLEHDVRTVGDKSQRTKARARL